MVGVLQSDIDLETVEVIIFVQLSHISNTHMQPQINKNVKLQNRPD